jgi:hypothetical protein
MMRAVLLLCLLTGASVGAQPTPPRIAVLPFQALSGDVPSRAGPRVAARLASELRALDGLALTELPAPAMEDLAEALSRARAAVTEAAAARQARDFPRAEALLAEALESFRAAAPSLAGSSELADAYALRAAVQYATGRDEEAARSLAFALGLSRGRPLPLAATSPLFARTVEATRQALEAQPPGTLRFTSLPPGVPVSVEGQPLGPTPLRVVRVPPGVHLWRAQLPSGEPVGGLVEVAAGGEAEVEVRPPGEGPGARLATSLAGNRLDARAVEAALALAREAQVELLLFGTVSRAGTGLALDAFVLAPRAQAPRRLPRLVLDAELLDAGPPLRELAGLLAARGVEAGKPEALPATVAPALPTPRMTEARYPGVLAAPVEAPPPTSPPADRLPLTPRKPLLRP